MQHFSENWKFCFYQLTVPAMLYVCSGSAGHFMVEAWKLVTTNCIRKSFLKYGFPFDHVSKNGNALILEAGE
jgi:hypothetical protein